MDTVNGKKIEEMYRLRRSMSRIQKETGCSKKTITEYLKEKKMWTGHKYMPMYFNEFFFDDINTEEKAYWLGFIYADGYLAQPRTIGIELKSIDQNHLIKFKKSLEAEHDVKIYIKNSTFGVQENCRIAVSSKHMFNILLGYFGSHRKTFEGHFPVIQNQKLMPHLIRGFFDGDGSLSWTKKDNEHIISPQISFIGTKKSMLLIEELSGFKWNWSQRHPERKNNNYQINCGRVNDCINFLNYMYKDSIVYLDRKYEKYQILLENRQRLIAKARV
jgi:hypothetical protein